MSERDRFLIRSNIEIICIACGTLFTVFTVIGWLGMAQGLFPVPANLTPEATAAYFAEHSLDMRTGCLLYIIGAGLFGLWIAQLGMMLAPIEGPRPVLTVAGVTAGNGVVALNDAAWHGFLLTWPALSVQMISTGVITRLDGRTDRLVPRWLSTFSIVCGVGIAMASGPAWAKSGPFAWNGALAYYVPMLMWGAWFELHSWYMLMQVLRERRSSASGIRTATA
jgi:hypothetical protein